MDQQDNVNVSAEYDGSIIHYTPQAIERSYSPLIETDNEATALHSETWKITTAIQHGQNTRNSKTTTKKLPQEPLHITLPEPHLKIKRKQLPPIPTTVVHGDYNYDSPFMHQHNHTAYTPQFGDAGNLYFEEHNHQYTPTFAPASEEYVQEGYPYSNNWIDYHYNHSLSAFDDYYVQSPTGSSSTVEQEVDTITSQTNQEYSCTNLTTEENLQGSCKSQQLPSELHGDKSIRQITVHCVTNDYRVWITVEPEETGKSIAKKMEALASFHTRRVTSITAASGRKIGLNKVPIFMHWRTIDSFEHGETWTVTWGPLKKPSLVDMVLSKLVQV